MDKEEYYKRIERINNRFKTDRVSADEEYQLVCQRNYLSTKYIENLEQQCKKQKEVIIKVMNLIKKYGKYDGEKCTQGFQMWSADFNKILDILKEVEYGNRNTRR